MKVEKNRYIVRKYIMAVSASDAIRLDKKAPVNEVYIDEDYKKGSDKLIGFTEK